MASADAAASGGLRTARRRRIEEVRQLQQQRRRQALEPQLEPPVPPPQQLPPRQWQQQENQQHTERHGHWNEETMYIMQHQEHQQQAGHQGDANTMASTPARSAASASTRSTSRSRMSAKRQNMMQRRIEMRRRNEERERQQQLEEEAQRRQGTQQRHQHVAAPTRPQHTNSHGQASAQQSDDTAQGRGRPQHFPHLPQPMLPHRHQQAEPQPRQPQQRHRGQSILKNAADGNLNGGRDHSSQQQYSQAGSLYDGQQQQQHQYQQSHTPGQHGSEQYPRTGSRQDAQQHYEQQQSRPPGGNVNYHTSQQRAVSPQDGQQQYQQHNHVHQQQQQSRPPMHDGQQYHHSQSAPYNMQPRPQPGQPSQYSRALSTQQPLPKQPPPMAIPSPPMLQRRQQFEQIPVYHRGVEEEQRLSNEAAARRGQLSHAGRRNQGVYNEAELEQSGIIRNNGSSHTTPQNTNRLKTSQYDSPSDEWFGLNDNPQQQGNMQQQQTARNRFEHHSRHDRQTMQQQKQPVRNQYEQPNHHQLQQRQQQPVRHVGQRVTNVDVQQQGVLKNPSTKGIHMQRNRFSHDRQEPQHYQNQNEPNWNDINQKYHDDNRQRHYQRQLASRQQTQQSMPQQPQSQPQNNNPNSSSQQPSRPSRILDSSPVEHLGNRTELIQRKNNGRSPGKDQNHQPVMRSNSCTMEGGEDSNVSVSEQARKFEKASARRNSHLNASADSSNLDEETVSVASLRKGWESKPRAKSAPRSRMQSSPTRTTSSNGSSAFSVWEERANRLSRVRRQEQRKEQRKNIEDRWRRNAVKSLPPEERGGRQQGDDGDHDGYQSEGHARRGDLNRYADGYQSEGPPPRRSHGQVVRGDYHDGYQTDGQEEGQEIEYEDTLENVDSGPITVQDARRRLWDQEERLRAVLPQAGRPDGIGNVRDRWPEEKQRAQPAASPSNYSGSSGGLFKSKFVHAAALVTRDRANLEQQQQQQQPPQHQKQQQQQQRHQQPHQQQQRQANAENEEDFEERRNRWAKAQRTNASEADEVQERMQQRRYEERQNPRKAQHQQQQQQQQKQQQHQQQHSPRRTQKQEINAKKNNHLKSEVAASSHYTDSTAETTYITTPCGSFGSTNLRKVSLSPPKRSAPQLQQSASSAMPPIAEQKAASPPPTLQKAQPRSVADLIARINAVSRSNPEEALAAIDCILKTESSGGDPSGDGICGGFVCGDTERINTSQKALRGTTPSQANPPSFPGAKKKNQALSLFSPSRPEEATPPPKTTTRKANGGDSMPMMPVRAQLGKDFFKEKYEEVLRADSERVIRNGEDGDDDEDGGSLMSSSEESTVSSMTDPTYQSLRSSPNTTTEPPTNIRQKGQQRSEQVTQARKSWKNNNTQQQQPQHTLSSKPQKSWSTLRKEYTERKTPSPNVTATPSNGIGVDEFEFNPDDIEVEVEQEQSRQQPQPQTVPKAGTNEFNTGFCGGFNYHMASSGSKPGDVGVGGEYDHDAPPTPSTLTDSAWVPMPNKGNVFKTGGGKNNNNKWPFTGNAPTKNGPPNMPPLLPDQRSNIRAASALQQHNGNPGINVVPKQRRNAKAQPNGNVNVTKHIQPAEYKAPSQLPTAKPSTPDVMKTVSDAFSDVDISFDEGRSNMGDHARRLIQQTRARPMMDNDDDDGDPPLQHFDEDPQSSLQTISEAFSDVDIDFDEEAKKTVGQRRKELEYLANTWTKAKSKSTDDGDGRSSSLTLPRPPGKAASWANAPQKSTAAAATKYKKVGEPTLRLKGNKSLAQKFASLVKAYDD